MSGTVTDLTVVLRDGIFIAAILTAAAYWKWHLWWKTGFGRTRMLLLLALAGVTLEPALHHLTGIRDGTAADRPLDIISLLAVAGVLGYLLYVLSRIIVPNLRLIQHPADYAEEGREHLRHTPWATEAETSKLLMLWDEMNGGTHSAASVQPDQETPKKACLTSM